MKRKVMILCVAVLFASLLFVSAEEPKAPQQYLQKGDVVRFIQTFPKMKVDFENFGADYEAKSGQVTFPEAMKASQDFLSILKKHGWDENFFQKMHVIALGYSAIVYGQQIGAMDAEMAKSLKEIESNPHISADMKKQLKAQLMAASGLVKQQGTALGKNIHPADLGLIKPHIEQLKIALNDKGEDK